MTMGLACDRDGYDLRAPKCMNCGSRGCLNRDRCEPTEYPAKALPKMREQLHMEQQRIGVLGHTLSPSHQLADAVARIADRCAPPLVPAARHGDWMQTSQGRQFWPMDPRPEEIHIEDIASALSKLCRYGGQCKRFYSVAEHCVLMARVAPDGFRLSALLHDASEAYLSDVIRPIKRHLSQYTVIEAALESAIATRYGIPYPMPAEVKRLDNAIITDEREQNMATPPVPWQQNDPALGVTLQFWTPEKAEFEFLAAFSRYGGHWC